MTSAFSPSFFIGVDGGGTRCRARLKTATGEVVGEGEGGPANIRLGLERSWGNILSAIDAALKQAHMDSEDYHRVSLGLGLAGIVSQTDCERTIAAGPRFGGVNATTDAHVAVLGAFSGRDGGILIAGTGSAAYAWVNGYGRPVGGWGFEVCDDGSAAALGREAIRITLQAFDGLAPETPFTRAVMSHFGDHPQHVVEWVDAARPLDYGALAPMTMSFADDNDPVAMSLVQASARELERYITRLRDLGCEKVCMVGGMSAPIKPWLSAWVSEVLASPDGDAIEGAILLAQGMSNGFSRQTVII